MPQLRIERVPIRDLQVGGFDHLHLVLEPDRIENSTYPQDEWFGIEGTFQGPLNNATLATVGGNGTTTLPELNQGLTGTDLQDVIGTPGERGSRVLSVAGDPFVAWNFMAALARDLDNQNLPYQAQLIASRYTFNINSSSVAATLLYAIGIEIANNLPYGVGRSNGWQTLLGTTGDDTLRIESTFVNLVGGLGDDTFFGSNTPDQFERFSGGIGDDTFFWSEGSHTYHGGQARLDYGRDGIDTIDYANIGEVHFEINPARIPHLAADIIATHATGQDFLLSIERIKWGAESDTIHLGEGLGLLNEGLVFDLGEQSSLDNGDQINFSSSSEGLQLVAATNTDIVFAGPTNASADGHGVWLESTEWIVGTNKLDEAYLGWGVRGFEGGAGDDIIDVREITAFEASSPNGYDIEILAGPGNDTIVAGHGRVFANGGAGSDRFVVSELSNSANGMNELVIEGADASDRLFASYNFFNESFAPFEDAQLLPILGAISQFEGQASFADLPQHEGPFTNGQTRSDFFAFAWQTDDDRFFNDDATDGVIDFAGNIYFNRDGSDLLIHIFGGFSLETEEIGANGTPYTFVNNLSVPATEVQVRVVNFQEGDLGIQFYDIGVGEEFDYSRPHGDYTGTIHPNWDQHINALTNNGQLTAPLAPRPDAPTYDPNEGAPPPSPDIVIGSSADDVIVVSASTNQDVSALDGNDTVTTSDGNDRIDGGAGEDTMTGGGGDDTYVVDHVNDTVVETASGGADTILSSVNFTLPEHVENLTLLDAVSASPTQSSIQSARTNLTTLDGSGNALRNALIGNSEANTLSGLDGNDVLYGGAGDDVLIGGDGSDHYVYHAGDGDDQILDIGSLADVDELYLEGIDAGTVSFYQVAAAPENLIITFGHNGRIEVSNFFDAGGQNNGIDIVNASDATRWTRNDIQQILAGTTPRTNEAPQAADEDSFVFRGPAATLPAHVLLANDRDYDGDPLSIISVTSDNPEITATVSNDGDIALSSAVGFEGAALLTYTISDGRGGQASAQVVVALYPNHAPNVADIAAQTNPEDMPWSFTLPTDLYNDPDGDAVTVSASLASGDALPSWLTFDASTETFSGTPPQNFNGLVSLAVTFSDGEADTTRLFDLTITPVNDAPDAQNDSGFETNEDESLVILASELLGNDIDVDGDSLSLDSVSNAIGGTAALNSDGNVVFTPTPGYSGPAQFDYSVTDPGGARATASVEITVVKVPDPPNPATIVGTPNNDRLIGTDLADVFDGLAGHDRLVGRAGNDTFLGGDGRDVLIGGRGIDTADYTHSPEAISLTFYGIGWGQGGHADGDVLFSIESVRGSSHDDVVIAVWGDLTVDGNGGNDILTGGFGRDHLSGGTGADQLTGGFASDTFVFSDGDGHDTITDFSTQAGGWWWLGPQSDTLALDISGVTTLADVRDHASEANGNVTLDFGNGDSLTLQNMRLSQLEDADIQFI